MASKQHSRPLLKAAALGLSVLAMAAPIPLEAQDSLRAMVPEDAFRLRSLGSPALSPDGAWVAYTVATTDLEDEERETRLWMVPSAGGEAIPMTRAGESIGSPAWSPDNRFLSFTATRGEDAESQVWVLDRRGGEAWALTDEKQSVSSYEWSPDGSKILLVMRDEEVEDSTWTSDEDEPWVVDRLQFKRDGTGYLTDARKSHLYVFDVATRATRQITAGNHDEAPRPGLRTGGGSRSRATAPTIPTRTPTPISGSCRRTSTSR